MNGFVVELRWLFLVTRMAYRVTQAVVAASFCPLINSNDFGRLLNE